MPKIQDIINDLQISREDLAAAYKKAVGKTLPARAVNIKDDELKLVEKELEHPGKTSAKKSPAKAPAKSAKASKEDKKEDGKDDTKVLKGDELFG